MSTEQNTSHGNGFLPAVFSLKAVQQRVPELLGQVLTVIDASVHEATARKAMKDLVKQQFYLWIASLEREAAFLDPDGHGRTAGRINLEDHQA